MMATSLVSRLALRGLGGLGGLGGRMVTARPLHASATVLAKHVWYPDVDWVGASTSSQFDAEKPKPPE